jgi:hypothetical protein
MPEILHNPFVFVCAILVLTVALPTVVRHWYLLRKAELEASLKQEMIQRGMSAGEIKMVLEAPQVDGQGQSAWGGFGRAIKPCSEIQRNLMR